MTISALASIGPGAMIHPSATVAAYCVVEPGSVLAEGVTVGEFTIIRSGARIGARTVIGPHCVIGGMVSIGEDCRFTAYCEIREGCRVGDAVRLGSRGTLSAGTVVGDRVTAKYSFVTTDTPDLGDPDRRVACTIGAGAMFGANVTLMPGVHVGPDAVIGACSQVRTDVPAGEVWFGSPATRHRAAGA